MIVGVGCDITKISRFKKNQSQLANKILTLKEMELYNCIINVEVRLKFLAEHFAAKEAIIKAIDQEKLLSEIEILENENGKPYCILEGYRFHLTISCEKDYAIAYAICEK